MKFRELKLSTTLFGLFGILMIGLAGFAAQSFSTLGSVRIGGGSYKEIVRSKDLIADVLPPPAYILESYLVAHQLVTTTDPTEIDTLAAQLTKLRSDFELRHDFWQQDLQAGNMKQALLVDSYNPAERFYEAAESKLIPLVRKGNSADALSLLQSTMKSDYQAHRTAIDNVVSAATDYNKVSEASAKSKVKSLTLRLELLLVAIFILGIGLVIAVVRSIVRPLREITDASLALAEGDLGANINYESSNELGQLAEAFRTTITNVSEAMGAITVNADAMAGEAKQLDSLSRQLVTSAEATENRAHAVSLSAETVSSDITTIAASTNQTAATVDEIVRAVAHVMAVVDRASDITSRTSSTVATLDSSSVEIGEVVALISRIATQTNLLALNATIEASRAGTAGRGFAVVAKEVKDLAEATAQAVESISLRIESMQGHTQSVVGAMGQIQEVINEISGAQHTIVAAFEEQSVNAATIGATADHVAGSSEEISSHIAEVAAAARQTSGSAADTHGAAERLARTATDLRGLVARFRLVDA